MNVGDAVIWDSRTGPTEAEYRGRHWGPNGYAAVIIVRPAGSCPYQLSVPQLEVRAVPAVAASEWAAVAADVVTRDDVIVLADDGCPNVEAMEVGQ